MDANTLFANLKPSLMDAGEIFSGKPSGTMIQGYDKPCPYTPKIDPDFIFHESVRDIIVWLLNPVDPLYIYGPLGCGKSNSIRQLAARLNYPVFEITAHGRQEFADLVGHLTVQKNSMSYEYGPLSLAMRYGGIFLLNEIDLTSPDIAAGLNGVLDGAPLCIAENGGELIEPNPMFRFIATDNTNGAGDDTGLYQGTQRQNIAFADRFTLCEMGYPDSEVEKRLLAKKVPSLPETVRDTMVDYANEVRKLFMGEATDAIHNQLEVTFSTRSLLRWAELSVRFQPLARQGIQPVEYALDRALGFRANRESRAMLHELAQRMFPVNQPDIKLGVFDADEKNLTGENGIQYLTSKLFAVPTNREIRVHLRKTWNSPDGLRNKDWIAASTADGLSLSYGKPANIIPGRFYKPVECLNGNPLEELKLRASKKLSEGYSILLSSCNF